MSTIDIFAVAKEKVMPKWAKFEKAGDKVQGTLIGVIKNQASPMYPTSLQHIYQLLQEDGSILNVAFGVNKKVLHANMEQVKFGQIVGFIYNGIKNVNNRHTGQMVNVKDYSVVEDSTVVDEKWLEENKDSMPKITEAVNETSAADKLNKEFSDDDGDDDVPFK